ncbi:MAG: response regulator transcription factor [Anaerolineales bacterium]|nr:response regulator transcription factor [Anaerolineales bacterium]
MSGQLLFVEDDDAIAAFVLAGLEREGFSVARARTGPEALAYLQSKVPELVLLDLMLPGEVDGLQVCRTIRNGEVYIPIIMVTARDEAADKIVGLELGADDYITKPFNLRELLARVRAILRLAHSGAESRHRERLRLGSLEIDLGTREVFLDERPVSLTRKEFDLLVVLASHRGRVFGRETLLQQVWGYDFLGDSRTVDVHIQRLRHKLEQDPASPCTILTVHGIGYKFAAERDG